MWSKSANVDAVFSKGFLEVLNVVLQRCSAGLGESVELSMRELG